MKKLLSLVLLFGMAGLAQAAEQVGIPLAHTGITMQHSDLVGIRVSTQKFKSVETFVDISTTVGVDEIIVYGVNFSSGFPGDYVQFHDTDSAKAGGIRQETDAVYRVYNIANSTVGAISVGGSSSAGYVAITPPLRFYRGLSWASPGTSEYNLISVHYLRRETGQGTLEP